MLRHKVGRSRKGIKNEKCLVVWEKRKRSGGRETRARASGRLAGRDKVDRHYSVRVQKFRPDHRGQGGALVAVSKDKCCKCGLLVQRLWRAKANANSIMIDLRKRAITRTRDSKIEK